MANLCLVVPPFVYHSKTTRLFNDEMPSIGVAYIAAALKNENHNVSVVDGVGDGLGRYTEVPTKNLVLHGLALDEIVERIPVNTDVIGVSCMFSHEWGIYKNLIQKISKRFPEKTIVLGGEHATADWAFILNSNVGVHACVIGEGEETILELAKKIDASEDWNEIDGIACLKNGVAVCNPRRKRIKSFNELLPAWELFPIQKYLDFKSGMNVVNRSCMPILASRGCPHSCTFCSSPLMWGHSYVNRSAKEIVNEMKHWKSLYPKLEHFVFTDLTMTLKEQWTIEFAQELKNKNLNLSWNFGPGTRTEVMTPAVLRSLKESQLVKVAFAAESGSENTLKLIKKKVNLSKMMSSMKYSSEIRLPSRCTIIYGFPGQTKKDCWGNIKFAFNMAYLGVDEVSVFFFAPYPGSELHNQLVEQNLIPNKITEPDAYETFLEQTTFSNMKIRSWSTHITSTQLSFLLYITHFIFLGSVYLFHPTKIYYSLKRVLLKKPATTIEAIAYSFLNKSVLRQNKTETV